MSKDGTKVRWMDTIYTGIETETIFYNGKMDGYNRHRVVESEMIRNLYVCESNIKTE